MQNELYFDNAATTRISAKALNSYVEACNIAIANPSSNHKEGNIAHVYLEEKRDTIASVLKVKSDNIFFTSGGSESISIILSPLLLKKTPGEIIVSKIEHQAVLSFESSLKERGWKVNKLRAKDGFISPIELEELITEKTKLVALQLVNNVTGAIQDISSLVKVVRKKEAEFGKKIFFFTDSVQALGKIKFSLTDLDVDAACFSAHKISGPRGIGLLYLKNPIFNVVSSAGGQEKGIRGGTENIAAISAFSTALEEVYKKDDTNVKNINKTLREIFTTNNIKVLSPVKSSPFILTISTPLPSQVLTRILNDEGFSVSAGSACSTKQKKKNEEVLNAMGFSPKESQGSIRISFNHESCLNSAINLANKIIQTVKDF